MIRYKRMFNMDLSKQLFVVETANNRPKRQFANTLPSRNLSVGVVWSSPVGMTFLYSHIVISIGLFSLRVYILGIPSLVFPLFKRCFIFFYTFGSFLSLSY